jgi:4-hydroxybenzoate polyprenyltransferase
MERPVPEPDGTVIAAVHLGQHHGFMGALIFVSALLLSRPRLEGRLATATLLYVSLALAYGAVNMTQDAWNEQLWKRGTVDWKIPSGLLPRLEPIWLVTLALAALAALALHRESRSDVAA